MQRSVWMTTMILAAGVCAAPVQAEELSEDLEARVNASRATVKMFGQQLQAELKAALTAGGPLQAIEVCNVKAPAIATQLSEQQGMTVARTSRKPRNPANAPDVWELQVLSDFAARKAAGEGMDSLETFKIVETDGKAEFRYMKAIGIPAEAPCLTCHGDKLKPEVQAQIRQLYPQDQAVGYKTGDLRGAFSLRQPL